MEPMDASLNNFFRWAKEHHVFIDERIEFLYEREKGIFARLKERVEDGEQLIKVPKELTVGPELASGLLPDICYENDDSFSNNEVTILLICKLGFDRKHHDHKFKPYFDILPKQINSPYFWSGKEKSLIEDTDAGIISKRNFNKILKEWYNVLNYMLKAFIDEETKRQIKNDLKFYKEYCDGRIDDEKLEFYLKEEVSSWTSFKSYMWSYSILLSRGFPYILITEDKSKGTLKKAILLPVVDLLNHKNDSKVQYGVANENEGNVGFKVKEPLNENDELFNNYGNKPNIDLLINYGFVIANNLYEETSITLRIANPEKVTDAKNIGNKFFEDKEGIEILKEGINFTLKNTNPFPADLLTFVSFLTQLKFERKDGMTLRMKLEGLGELKKNFEGKIFFLKQKCLPLNGVKSEIAKLVKIYRNSQRNLFQKSYDCLQQYEKKLLKEYKDTLTSFKGIMKSDKTFMVSLSTQFGITSYEDLIERNLLENVTLLWLVRVSNKEEFSDDKFFRDDQFLNTITYVLEQFDDVQKTIEVTDEDILEFKGLMSFCFPKLSLEFPSIYSQGDWSTQRFVVASTVMDRVGYLRPSNHEFFIIKKISIGV